MVILNKRRLYLLRVADALLGAPLLDPVGLTHHKETLLAHSSDLEVLLVPGPALRVGERKSPADYLFAPD